MRHRLEVLTNDERAAFMVNNGMGFDPISSEERSALSDKLIGLAGVTEITVHKTIFFK
jgi:hypothetical protein